MTITLYKNRSDKRYITKTLADDKFRAYEYNNQFAHHLILGGDINGNGNVLYEHKRRQTLK